MGWIFRKLFNFGPIRLNLSRKGLGWSFGLPFMRVGISPAGKKYVSLGIPGTGVYFIKYFSDVEDMRSPDKPCGFPEVTVNPQSYNQDIVDKIKRMKQ